MQPLAKPPLRTDGRFDDWMFKLWQRISTTGVFSWALIDKTGAKITDIPDLTSPVLIAQARKISTLRV